MINPLKRIRNLGVKVTGFSLQPSLEYKLKQLFSRVAQVRWVQLAPDKNSAKVYFQFKSALTYITEHDWRLGNDSLKLHLQDGEEKALCVGSSERTASKHPLFSPSNPLHESPKEITYTLAAYQTGQGQSYGDDVYLVSRVPPRRKRKRHLQSSQHATCASDVHQRKRRMPKKKKKKRGRGYLEAAAPLPFGSGFSALGTQEELSDNETTDVFLKGSETIPASLPKCASAADVFRVVSEKAGIPSEMLNITVGGRALSDNVAKNISAGSNIHFSVKGLGGADSENPGGSLTPDEPKKKKKKKKKKGATGTTTSEGTDATSLQPDAPATEATPDAKPQASTSSESSEKSSPVKQNTTGAGECLPNNPGAGEPEEGAAAFPLSSQSETALTEPVDWTLASDAGEEETKQWLLNVCHLDPASLHAFEDVDAKTLKAYKGFKDLLKHTENNISYGKARGILYRLRKPKGHVPMADWSVDNVIAFIRSQLEKPDLNLSSFKEKDIDGVAFLAFDDAEEIIQDFKWKGIRAQRILTERNASPAFIPAMEEGNEKDVEPSVDQGGAGSDTPRQIADTEPMASLVLSPADEYSPLRVFVQNKLCLLPLDMNAVDGQTLSRKLTPCCLRILRVKETKPSYLDNAFLFFLLTSPEFQMKFVQKVWKSIKECTADLWKGELERHDPQLQLSVDDTRLLLRNSEIAFSKTPTASLVCLADYRSEDGKGFEKFPLPVLLVDKHFVTKVSEQSEPSGYTCKLGNKKSAPAYPFRFDRIREYFCFDSNEFPHGIEASVPDMWCGTLPTCLLEMPAVERQDEETASPVGQQPSQRVEAGTLDLSDRSDQLRTDTEAVSIIPRVSRQISTLLRTSCVVPRIFRQDPTKTPCYYEENGILDMCEIADGMLNRTIEFKDHSHHPQDKSTSFQALVNVFVKKALVFICGCINARKNGTIYFGVNERGGPNPQVLEHRYPQVSGVRLSGGEKNKYIEALKMYLDVCFEKGPLNVSDCVFGPYFVRIKSSTGEDKFVVEIDVEPTYDRCENRYLKLVCANKIDKSYVDIDGVYFRDNGQNSGIVQTRKLIGKDLEKFQKESIKRLAENRKKEDASWTQLIEGNPETKVRMLRRFMAKCNKVDTILLIAKPAEMARDNLQKCLKFVKFVRWVAVFDFDNESSLRGLLHSCTSSETTVNVTDIPINKFDKRKAGSVLSKKTLWLMVNGNAACKIPQLTDKEWKKQYYPHLKEAVSFLNDRCVVSPGRYLILVMISGEFDYAIVKTVEEIVTSTNLCDRVFIVCDHAYTSEAFLAKTEQDRKEIEERMAVLPWETVNDNVCEVLDVLKEEQHIKVKCSNNPGLIPPRLWRERWTDLNILKMDECGDMDSYCMSDTALQEEKRYYNGGPPLWANFHFNHVVERQSHLKEVESEIKELSEASLGRRKAPKVVIYHMPKAGGTTLAKHVLWKSREQCKCAVVKQLSQNTFDQVVEFWAEGEHGKEANRNPVLLLVDVNTMTEEESRKKSKDGPTEKVVTESNLCEQLLRKQQREKLLKPIAIVLVCYCTFQEKIDGIMLKHKIEDEEELRSFDEIYKRQEKSQRSKSTGNRTMFGILALRTGFDKKKLQECVIRHLENKDLKLIFSEMCLIEYLSVIVSYFPVTWGSPGIPVRGLDYFFAKLKGTCASRNELCGTWEDSLSEISSNLLVFGERNFKNQANPTQVVALPSERVAEIIRERTVKKYGSLAEVVIELLNSNIVDDLSCWDFKNGKSYEATAKTVEIIQSMLITRVTRTGSKTYMSPLILAIIQGSGVEKAREVLQESGVEKAREVLQESGVENAREVLQESGVENAREVLQESGVEKAREVLQLGYDQMRGSVFYQQLARLFSYKVFFPDAKDCAHFEKAKEYASIAVDISPENEFKHTLGLVCLKYFHHVANLRKTRSHDIHDHKLELDCAVSSFQALSEAQTDNDIITKAYASCDLIKLITHLLTYFNKSILQPTQKQEFGIFLMEGIKMRSNLFKNKGKIEKKVAELLKTGFRTLKWMFRISYSYRVGNRKMEMFIDSKNFSIEFTRQQCKKQFAIFASKLKTFMPELQEPCDARRSRLEILFRKGSFFESILDKISNYTQKTDREKTYCRKELTEILDFLLLIKLKADDFTSEDKDIYITVCIALELIEAGSHFTEKAQQIYGYCEDMATSRVDDDNEEDFNARKLRADMFRLIVNWPTWIQGPGVCSPLDFPNFFKYKYVELKCKEEPMEARVHFFVSNRTDGLPFLHWTEIFPQQGSQTRSEPSEDGSEAEYEEAENQERSYVTQYEDCENTEVMRRMRKMLRKFKGTYLLPGENDLSRRHAVIEFEMPTVDLRHKFGSRLTLRAFKGQKVYVNSNVKFYLGFSLHGPVAYIYEQKPHP